MHKNYGIGILIVCFGFPSVNAGLAAETGAISTGMARPYDLQTLNQQMLERDRQNRDEEIAITGLIEENNELIRNNLSRQQAEGLQKVNQIMLDYRNALLSRDRQRIAANSQRPSRWDDLIALSRDVQAMKGAHQDLVGKSNLIEEKYKILNDLKDEMVILNARLKGPGSQQGHALSQKDTVIEGYKKTAQQQQEKIQMLVGRLGDMDQKIAHFDEILAQKDRQIVLLKAQIQKQAEDLKTRDDALHWLKEVLAATKTKAEFFKLSSEQIQMPTLASPLGAQLTQKQQQIDLLKEGLAEKITHQKNQGQLEAQIQDLKTQLQVSQERIGKLKTQIHNSIPTQARVESLKQQLVSQQDKVALLKEELESKIVESNKLTSMVDDYQKKLEYKDNAYNDQLRQALSYKKHQAETEKQISYLNKEIQAKDLSLVMMQQRMDEKTKVPRGEIRSLRQELALDRLRLEDYAKTTDRELLKKVAALTKKLDAARKKLHIKIRKSKVAALETQLNISTQRIKALEAQVKQLESQSKGDAAAKKLKQALDKIQEQGRLINTLSQKLRG